MTRPMQCICQICNCGKHHCPCESEGSGGEPPPHDACDIIAVAPGDEDPLISEYQRRFQAHPDAVRTTRPHHDDHYKPPQGKMADTTTFRSDYVQHPLILRNLRPKSAYVPPEGEMRSGTTYTEDYQRHPAPAMQPHMQNSHHSTRGQQHQLQMSTAAKMDALSTYKDEFRTWPLQRRQPYREVDNLSMTREAACRFTATTTFRDDYQPVTTNVTRQPCKPAASCLNMYQGQGQSAPFTSTTNYRLQYVKHPLEASKRPCSAPVRGTPSSHVQLQNIASAAFQNTTEFRDKYQAWPVTSSRQQQPRQIASYVVPSGSMVFDTTTHTDYIRHEGAEPPPRALKPVIQAWGAERPIAASNRHPSHHAVSSTTTRGRPAERRLPGKTHQHQGETEGSRAATTYRSNYTSTKTGTKTGHRNSHRSPPVWKPCGIASHANPTSTRRARTPNPQDGKAPACPASFTEPPGYQDTHTTVSGHRMFQRTLSGAEDGPGKRGVATVTNSGQSQQPQRRGHSAGSATVVVADGRGRGQH